MMKRIIFVILVFSLASISIYYSCYVNTSNFSINIDNNVKVISTSFLEKVVDKEEIPEENKKLLDKEEKTDVVSFDNNKEIKTPVEEKSIEQGNQESKEVSTTIVDDSKKMESSELDSVYVGLKFEGSMTAYGKDCCSSDLERQGITATGFDLKTSLTYNDPVYGSVRIVASDKNFKYYSIIKVNDPIDGVYNAIVLDRAGSVIGLNKVKKFDLAVESEAFAAHNYGVHRNVSFEVLRVGK